MSTQIVPLNSSGLLQIAGPDSEKFLQGQLTCDLGESGPDHLINGAHCTNKGRVIANFSLLRSAAETFLLRLPKNLLDNFQQSLNKYIVFSKAETQQLLDETEVFGIISENSQQWLQDAIGVELSDNNQITTVDNMHFIKRDDRRIECWIPKSAQQLPAFVEASNAAETLWQLEDIQAGIAWCDQNTSEEFLPQMLNLDLPAVSGISFKKGCYTGQEIVARLHYKGQAKRRLYHLELSLEQNLTPGADIYCDAKSSAIGNLVTSVPDQGKTHMLAVVSIEEAENSQLYLDQDNQEKLTQVPLPYAINSDH